MSLDRSKVQITDVTLEPFVNEKYSGVVIRWIGSIGFGEYSIYKSPNDDKWHADSEAMDTQEDHWFIDLLIKKLFESEILID